MKQRVPMRREHTKPDDSKKRQDFLIKKVLSILILVAFLIPPMPIFAEEWNKGGSLHQASVSRWTKASEANRLATSADWFMAMTRQSNKPLLEELKAMDEVDYQAAFKYYATRLENCISEKLKKKTVRYEEKVLEYAGKCYQTLHGREIDQNSTYNP